MQRELLGERHPDIAKSLSNVAWSYGKQGDLRTALEYLEQALAMYRALFGERHSRAIRLAEEIAITLVRLNRRKDAYDLVRHFVVLSQGVERERLKHFEAQLLSEPLRPGFKQPPKSGKRKGKKKRR